MQNLENAILYYLEYLQFLFADLRATNKFNNLVEKVYKKIIVCSTS